jgi:hypothetical protein
MLSITDYSDVICHSTAFFELTFKILFISEYNDVICHSTAFFV